MVNTEMPDLFQDNHQPQALSPAQTRVVVALAQGCSVSAAAETAGVHRTTVHRWLKDPVFDAAVMQTRDDYCETLADGFHALTGLAVTKLRTVLESPDTPPAVVARVSLALLNRRYFPKKGWEIGPMLDLQTLLSSENENGEAPHASLENLVVSDALCSIPTREPPVTTPGPLPNPLPQREMRNRR